MMMIVGIVVLVSIIIVIGKKKGGVLPPGTMGWPYIGETLQMYSEDPKEFFAEKLRKYGAVFKTHILGCPCVMVSSPEAAKFVLVKKAHLFKPTFPASKERMLGPNAIFFHQGTYHMKLRRLVLRAFSSPASLRPLVPLLDSLAHSTLDSLAQSSSGEKGIINTYQSMKLFAFDVALLSILGPTDAESCREDLKRSYLVLEKGYNSMPINLPGTLFHNAMSARATISRILTDLLVSRRRSPSPSPSTDLLSSFILDPDLTDDQIVDNVIGVIFAARDTTASVLTWVFKYLHDNPAVLEAVAEEQRFIQKLTWEHTKSMMPVTSRVIQETLRCASVLSFTFREAVEDVHYDGYLIPKGWKVLPLFRNIHHNPDLFPDPDKFDPSRFKTDSPPKGHTYMPFGSGTHSCPGNELAKIEMLVLLHHLTTKYTWSVVGHHQGIEYGPFALPHDGLPITLHHL